MSCRLLKLQPNITENHTEEEISVPAITAVNYTHFPFFIKQLDYNVLSVVQQSELPPNRPLLRC